MSLDFAHPDQTFTLRRRWALAGIAALAAAGVGAVLAQFGHGPDWGLFARQSSVIHLHVGAALTALLIGTVQLVGVKGTTVHRVLGWSWVIAMATTAISSLFIRQINAGGFSLIHLLSGWTLIGLPMAIFAIRRSRVAAHGRGMAGMFIGGLIIAGGFAFLPGRLMWEMFFG